MAKRSLSNNPSLGTRKYGKGNRTGELWEHNTGERDAVGGGTTRAEDEESQELRRGYSHAKRVSGESDNELRV